jgi:hypothetical protein
MEEYYIRYSITLPETGETRNYICKESQLADKKALAQSRNLILVVESEKEFEGIWAGFAEYY